MRKSVISLAYNSSILASISIVWGVFVTTGALAQETPEDRADNASGDIIVTAQRRSERLQNVPIAITAISADEIEDRRIATITGLATAAPSLNVVTYPNSSDTLTLTLRGQGAGDVGQITRDGGVGVYIDGFYVGRPQGALFDLGEPERIEVLRGPQGTLYGRNTTGGAINIITKQPTGEWGGNTSFSYGSRNLVRALGKINLAAIGNLAISASVVYTNKDGWVENAGKPHNYGEFGQLAGNVRAKWTPTSDFTVSYAFDQGRVTTTQPYYINPSLEGTIPGYVADRDRTYAPLDLEPSVSKFVDHRLTIEYAMNDDITVRSLSAYRGYRANQFYNYGLSQSAPTFPLTVQGRERFKTRQYTQEFQVFGDLTDQFNFTGGLFYFREDGFHRKQVNIGLLAFGITVPSDLIVDARSESYAAYMQSTWSPPIFDDKLKLTAGGRYTRDRRSADRDLTRNGIQSIDDGQLKFSNFSPMANLAFQWTPDIMTYLKFSKGYKSGGFAESTPVFSQTFGPEKVTAYEAGLKAQLFDRLLTFNLTAFYNKFDGIQLDVTLDPNDTSIGATYNAGSANIKGIEVESTLRPSPDLSLLGSFSYMVPKIDRVNVLPGSAFDGPFGLNDNIADQFTLPFVPKFSWTLGGDWTFLRRGGDEVSIHAIYTYQSRVYASAASGPAVVGRNFNRNDPTKNLNMRLKWVHAIPAGEALTFSLFADNLLNNRRADFIIGVGSGLDGFTRSAIPYNEPRTIGGEVKLEF